MDKKKKTPNRSGEISPKSEANAAKRESGLPGGGAGRRDVVELIPDGFRVDPYITEGNPGYDESGDSEIIRPERFSAGEAKAREKSRKS